MADRFDKFSERARRVLTLAQEEAVRFNHNYMDTEHLLLGLLREGQGIAIKVLADLGVELDAVRSAVESAIVRGDRATLGQIGLTPPAKRVIELAVDEARRQNHGYIGTEHILLGLVRQEEGIAARVLESLGVTLERVRTETARILGQSPPRSGQAYRRRISIASADVRAHSPLDQFIKDLTLEVRRGPIEAAAEPDPLVQRLIEVLAKRHRNNPVVLMRSERDREVTVLALAAQMARGEVPNDLARKRLVAMEFERLAASASSRGALETLARSLVDWLREAGDAVLIVDEQTALRGAEHGPAHAVTGLKPALAGRRLQCVVFATADEYRAALDADPALDGLLEPIDPEAPGAAPIVRGPESESRLPPLSELSEDLTAEVRPGEFELTLEEIKLLGDVVALLLSRPPRHAVLLGDSSAATRLAHALALRLGVEPKLRGRRLLALGAANRAEIGARLLHCVNEAAAAGPCILYVDDIHALAMPETIDALRAALSRDDVRFLGATAPGLYHRHLATDATLADRLWPVMLEGGAADG